MALAKAAFWRQAGKQMFMLRTGIAVIPEVILVAQFRPYRPFCRFSDRQQLE